jgi:DNA-binding CsgD family transcriptional regulator
MNEPHFDLYQFAGRVSKAITAETGIAFSDYARMGTIKRKNFRKSVPAFALDNEKLAHVLKHLAWRYAHGGKLAMPPDITLEELKKMTDARAAGTLKQFQRPHLSEYQRHIGEEHFRIVTKAGGYLQMYANVAWLGWRRGMDSVSVARETGIAPHTVRQHLRMMNKMARRLFPEDALPFNAHSQKMVRARKTKCGDPNPRRVANLFASLIQSGLTAKEVAQRMECSTGHVHSLCKQWEMKTGLQLKVRRLRAANRTYDPVKIRELRESGMPWNKVVAALGYKSLGNTRDTYLRHCKALGIAPMLRDFRAKKPKLVKTMKALLDRRAQRAAWIAQGLCGVDGKEEIWVGHSKYACKKHLEYYTAKELERQKYKRATVTAPLTN